MSSLHEHPSRPGALSAPRRNNYYFGKLMDVVHFQLEQNYGNGLRRMLNRLSLGEGVLCGLLVGKSADGLQICTGAGGAIDSLGREIVVPEKACIDPWTLTDECGQPAGVLKKDEPHVVHLCIAYRECGADFAPMLVEDCNLKPECVPGTIVESFRLLVQDKSPAPPADKSAICNALLGSQSAYDVVATVDVAPGKPVAVAVAPDGQLALVADETGPSLYFVDVETGTVTAIAGTTLTTPIGSVAVAGDATTFFVSHSGGIATVDFSATPAVVGSLISSGKYGQCVAMKGGVVFAINLTTTKVQRFNGTSAPTDLTTVSEPALLALSSDGQTLYVADAKNKKLVRVDTTTNAASLAVDLSDTPKTLATRPGDPAAYAAGDKFVARIPDTGTSPSFTIADDLTAGAFTGGGSRYYAVNGAASPPEIVIFATEGMTAIARVKVGEEPTGLAIVPDSRRALVTNSKSGTISIVDIVPRKHLCETLSAPCPKPPACPCVTLATIELRKDGTIGVIDACGARPVLYSNEMLLEFILCLAARLDECCGGVAPPVPTPVPPPPPPPPPNERFRITQIEFLNARGNAVAPLSAAPAIFPFSQNVAGIRVTFNRDVDHDTVKPAMTAGTLDSASMLVRKPGRSPFVPGKVIPAGARAATFLIEGSDTFPVSPYIVELFGDADVANGRPAITEKAATPQRLDGERAPGSGLPSGDGVEGGSFQFKFAIKED